MYYAEWSLCPPIRHAEQYVRSKELRLTDRKAISYLIFRYRPLDWTEALILVGPSRKILSLTTRKVKELAARVQGATEATCLSACRKWPTGCRHPRPPFLDPLGRMCLPRALFLHGLQYRFLFHQSSKERVANPRDVPFDKTTSGLLLLQKTN